MDDLTAAGLLAPITQVIDGGTDKGERLAG